MRKTDFKKFQELASKGEVVPVRKELFADMETPVSILKRFQNAENVFLLESVEGGETVGRYSFLGVNPEGVFRIEHGRAFYQNRELLAGNHPFEELKKLLTATTVARDPELPPLPGGAVGYVGYEAVGMFEQLPEPKTDPGIPEVLFLIAGQIIAFDNLRHTMTLIVNVHTSRFDSLREAFAAAERELAALEAVLKCSPGTEAVEEYRPFAEPRSNLSREEFCRMVEAGKKAIREGEVIQTVLSRKFYSPLPCSPLKIYRALRLVNPSPYMFFLKSGETILIGSSPETMVRLNGTRSNLRPIAGTRKRGASDAEDRALSDELLKDEKERAEHLMLVDLGRNDLGRTAEPGSVRVDSFMGVERYSHVMHLVSNVEAVLRRDCDAFDLLRTTFPAGTLSGAPKIRAMELIRELEPEARGVYGGCVGYLSYDGNMDMAITIRTMEIRNRTITVQAGAGIVADSVPEAEYEETANKAKALFTAIELAAKEL